jgi:TonB family protein
MTRPILSPYVREGSYGRTFAVSVLAHGLLVLLLALGAELLPAGAAVTFGSGAGGGRGGDYVTVGLTAELSGGAGMYMPAITPRPPAVSPPPRPTQPEAAKAAAQKDPNVFLESRGKSAKDRSKQVKNAPAPLPGQIPSRPEPGAGGPGGGSPGGGGGLGGGFGVKIGSGAGEGVIDSWYVRQVEQRIGGNWLKTSLGQLDRPVESVVSFEVEQSGAIANIRVEEKSGILSVDLAAERAVRASNPLPPLPYELRGRRFRFAAHFDYPPR